MIFLLGQLGRIFASQMYKYHPWFLYFFLHCQPPKNQIDTTQTVIGLLLFCRRKVRQIDANYATETWLAIQCWIEFNISGNKISIQWNRMKKMNLNVHHLSRINGIMARIMNWNNLLNGFYAATLLCCDGSCVKVPQSLKNMIFIAFALDVGSHWASIKFLNRLFSFIRCFVNWF